MLRRNQRLRHPQSSLAAKLVTDSLNLFYSWTNKSSICAQSCNRSLKGYGKRHTLDSQGFKCLVGEIKRIIHLRTWHIVDTQYMFVTWRNAADQMLMVPRWGAVVWTGIVKKRFLKEVKVGLSYGLNRIWRHFWRKSWQDLFTGWGWRRVRSQSDFGLDSGWLGDKGEGCEFDFGPD